MLPAETDDTNDPDPEEDKFKPGSKGKNDSPIALLFHFETSVMSWMPCEEKGTIGVSSLMF